ncbi:MAG: glycine cleavage system aminomethyltransferase GcvT, partial [bacterium]|nr:glycine cleavage system aminomethyltransferase GcvT [bacterium]
WLVNSGDPYVGKGVLEEQQRDGTPFEIIALELTEKGVPREDYQVLKGNATLGTITSGVYSPTLKKGIALAVVARDLVSPGDEIFVLIREKKVAARVVKKPFYQVEKGS